MSEFCVDCISRKEALKAIEDKAKRLKNADTINGLGGAIAILYELPSVYPKSDKELREENSALKAYIRMLKLDRACDNSVLEDIKAEISEQEITYRKKNDRCGIGLDMALRIIQKHISGKEKND